MGVNEVINELERNRKVFHEMLSGLPSDFIIWRPNPKGWCVLEIICHLIDEEVEDFRARVKHVLETPTLPLVAFDQLSWIKERDYIGQDFDSKLQEFGIERQKSVTWLKDLSSPKWENAVDHPNFGQQTALSFLHNWLAHDHHHIRQINNLKYSYHKENSGDPLTYAGKW